MSSTIVEAPVGAIADLKLGSLLNRYKKFNSSPAGCVRACNGLENYSNVRVAFENGLEGHRIYIASNIKLL
jgi:hypothetical protein